VVHRLCCLQDVLHGNFSIKIVALITALEQGSQTESSCIHRGYDWHGASIKNVMNAIQSLTSRLPGVPESLKGLPGIRPDPERLFMAGNIRAASNCGIWDR
jgi:hypothetical protein